MLICVIILIRFLVLLGVLVDRGPIEALNVWAPGE